MVAIPSVTPHDMMFALAPGQKDKLGKVMIEPDGSSRRVIDKFFTRMWKGVKGLWKVLKANESLPTSRPEEDGDDPATWSDDGGYEDSGATDTGGED
ncbi:hypothetical protein RDI58_013186 [Solanum bulbocastanum]|uniref:Uncharacterized protein n=1 Tax=Solanum bulbocastanum TaxID=147425 RepID=A0AAN8YEE3_SOLBU